MGFNKDTQEQNLDVIDSKAIIPAMGSIEEYSHRPLPLPPLLGNKSHNLIIPSTENEELGWKADSCILYREFVQWVQMQGQLNTWQEAEAVTKAVVETLGELLDAPIQENIKNYIPKELQGLLCHQPHVEYPFSEFYRRVEARIKTIGADPVICTWLVMGVIRDCLPDHDVWTVADSLLKIFGRFF